MIYDVGDLVKLSTVLKDTSGVVNNAATMTLAVTKPDATTTSPSVTNTGSGGVYTANVTIDQAGTWTYVWTASGAVVAVEPGQFTVRTQTVYVISMEEFKAQIRRTDDADDPALRTYLASATRYVESRVGPVSVQTFTERHFVTGYTLIPRRRPLVSITSITPDFGTVLDSTAYTADTDLNQIVFYWGIWPTWHTLVYKAGWAQLPENAKLAGSMVAQHLWDVQNGFAGRRPNDDLIQTGFGFAVPRRAEELLGVDTRTGVS